MAIIEERLTERENEAAWLRGKIERVAFPTVRIPQLLFGAGRFLPFRINSLQLCRADLRGAKIARAQDERLVLTEPQRQLMRWQADHGPEPNGG